MPEYETGHYVKSSFAHKISNLSRARHVVKWTSKQQSENKLCLVNSTLTKSPNPFGYIEFYLLNKLMLLVKISFFSCVFTPYS